MIKPLMTNSENIDESKIKNYLDELDQAINNDSVKNIALMGPYGSGKSSILIKQKEKDPSRYINVNMIEFSDDIENSNLSDEGYANNENNDKQRKIEKVEQSIIQQLIYQESQNTIPFSRIKKEYPIKNVIFANIVLFIYLLIGTLIFKIFNLINYINPFVIKSIYSWLSIILFCSLIAISCYLLLIGIYYFYRTFKITKINYTKNNTNLELERYESIYNKFLDEIIYFFKETKYDIVIFEDIDRYNDLLFFSHLRELNSLLNNSKTLGKKIKFIYAIRDDLFIKQDKTKFFDLIIPVLPIMDYSNSFYKFKEFIPENDISDDILKTLSLYVNDLRTLKNICNEYDLYGRVQNIDIFKKENLLSILVFKNLYPSEFAKLQYNESIIDKIFSEKSRIISDIKDPKCKRIEYLTKALKDDEFYLNPRWTLLGTIKDLVSPQYKRGYQAEIHGLIGKFDNLDEIMLLDVDWEKVNNISSIDLRYYYYSGYDTSIELSNNAKERLRKLVELQKNQHTILDKSRKEMMDEIDLLDSEINDYTNIKANKLYSNHKDKLRDILNSYKLDNPNIVDDKFISLLTILIQKDLINESYSNYISLTYKVKENENDISFIRNVYADIDNDFDLNLFNIDFIFSELKNELYEKRSSFNFEIINYLAMTNNKNLEKLLRLNKDRINLLYKKLDCNNENFNVIAKTMCKVDHNITNMLEREDDEYKFNSWIKFILCLESPLFSKLEISELLKEKVRDYDLIKLSKIDSAQISLFNRNVGSLNIKFINISGCEQNQELFNNITNNLLFEFNFTNLKIINKDIEYSVLSKIIALKNYIDSNIKDFVRILIDNNIKTIQSDDFYNYILSTIDDEDLLIKLFEMNPVFINNISIVKSEKLCRILSKDSRNILPILQNQSFSIDLKIDILSCLKQEFIEENADELYIVIKKFSIFNEKLIRTQFYSNLISYLSNEENKIFLIDNLLPILDDQNLLKILKIYNHDFRKQKMEFIVPRTLFYDNVVEKLTEFDLFEVSKTDMDDRYKLKLKEKSQKFI